MSSITEQLSPDPFASWLADRPKWLQTAAAQLIEKRKIPDQDEMALLVALCEGEAAGRKDATYIAVAHGALTAAPARPHLHINELSDVSGVNAIRNGACINFGKANIAIVYGQNGSGKSGFSRLLKHACGSRAKEDILPNIFEDEVKSPTATIAISYGEEKLEVEWTLESPTHRLLKDVHIFDGKSASLYMGAKNEASYEPRTMRFLSSLIKICDQVSTSLEEKKSALVKMMPLVPAELSGTSSAKWVSRLSPATKATDLEKNCTYTPELDSERIVGEQALNEKDIPGRLSAITKNETMLNGVKTYLAALKIAFGDEKIAPIIVARNTAQVKRKATAEDAKKVFAQAPLAGVGQESWAALWKHARMYSESLAYPEIKFPAVSDESLCVLCQQELDPVAKARLVSFEDFVKNGLEAEAVSAEKLLAGLVKNIPVMPALEAWKLQCGVLQIEPEKTDALFLSLKERWNSINSAVELIAVPAFNWEEVEEKVTELNSKYVGEKKTLTDLQQDGKRKELELRVLELKCIQWLNQNKEAIGKEISRLTQVKKLEDAISLARTHALTTKKNELSESALSIEYKTRFAAELEKLGGKRIPITSASKKEGKGKISIGLAFQDAKKPTNAGSVLSEGETRIVTLAAFLADIAGSGEPTPFIFDDPISSLDQSFEEAVVKRLVELSTTRQVVVFTHRLSLVTLVESVVDRLKQQAKAEGKDAPVSLNVQSLYRMGNVSGILNQLSIRDSNPQSAANRLRDQTISQLVKLHAAGDVDGYEQNAKSLCSDFRILVESCVEKILINDVVVRFRRSVETKNKVAKLAKITPEDCALIEDLMTRYSSFEHSQPNELPGELPDIEQLKTDTVVLAAWIDNFKKRA